MNVKSRDSEWQGWGEMTLNAKMMKDDDSKCLNEYTRKLWMPKLNKNGGTEY